MARVPYPDQSDLPEEYQDLIVSDLQPGKTVNVYRAIGNNPPVLAGLRSFLGQLWSESGLSDYQRELVILSVAKAVDSAYEWHQHVGIARDAGVSDDEILAIATNDITMFDTREQAMLKYAHAAMTGDVTDELHNTAATHFDEYTIVGLAAVASGYVLLARLIDACGVEIEDDFVGWELENE
jgi:alkylhydroperoxidase family enzyme